MAVEEVPPRIQSKRAENRIFIFLQSAVPNWPVHFLRGLEDFNFLFLFFIFIQLICLVLFFTNTSPFTTLINKLCHHHHHLTRYSLNFD